LAEAYFMDGDLESARDTISQAANLAPNDAQVCQKYGEYFSATLETRKQGLARLEKARLLNSNLEQIDFEIGKAQFDLTDFQDAIANFEKALKRNPEDGQAAFFLAESWGRMGDWEPARESYHYALTHAYTTGTAYYGLGRALVQIGEYQSAITPLRSALAAEPLLTQAHFQLSVAYRHLNRLQDADRETRLFADMSNRVDTSKEFNDPEEQRAWKHVRPLIDQGREQAALDYLSTQPDLESSGDAHKYYLLGAMYFSTGKKEDAQRVLRIAREKEPGLGHIAAYLGIVQLSSGDAAGAEQSFRSALASDPTEPLALIGMGTLSYEQQRWSDVITFIEKSRTSDPGVLYMLCDAYVRTAQTENAKRTGEIARAFATNRKELLRALDDLLKH
jgi:tetratricopeptide (TPR) repeat protein